MSPCPHQWLGDYLTQKPPTVFLFLMLYFQMPVLPVPFPGKSHPQPQLRGFQVTKLCVTLAPLLICAHLTQEEASVAWL